MPYSTIMDNICRREYTAFVMIIVQETEASKTNTPGKKSEARELILFICIAILCVLPIRLFIAQPFIVKGHSMYPTFQDKDYLIVNELRMYFKEPVRDEVVVFKHPNPPHQYLIKRIIGLPGETIQLRNGKVTIINEDNPKGFVLPETYIREPFNTSMTVELKDNEYFVMGDNRNQSSDSRVWGVLPKKNIVGMPLVRLLPVKNIGLHPGQEIAAQ